MSRIKLILGLVIIAAIITAGCTGTKTMVGNEHTAGQIAAQGDYKKYAGELKDEIDYIKTQYKPPANTTLDAYKAWLDGFRDKLALCRQMYNNTSIASKKYLGYLNSSSGEYSNVTADNARFLDDIASLDQAYGQYSDNLNTSIKKMAALENYKNKMNAAQSTYNDLTGFAKGAKITSVDAYSGFIDGFKNKATIYENSVDAAMTAGTAYLGYCEPGSAEYKAVQDNNNALAGNVKSCWDAYKKYKSDYDSKIGARSAAQAAFKDYSDKVGKASADKKDVDAYKGTAKALEKLDAGWLDGYKQKIDLFDVDANAAVDAGNTCKQYLDPSGQDYKSILDNEKNMKDNIAAYNSNYDQLETTFRNLHPLGSLLR